MHGLEKEACNNQVAGKWNIMRPGLRHHQQSWMNALESTKAYYLYAHISWNVKPPLLDQERNQRKTNARFSSRHWIRLGSRALKAKLSAEAAWTREVSSAFAHRWARSNEP